MTKQTFKNHYHDSPHKGEENSGEIVTIPGKALTVRQMIERYSAGILPDIQNVPQYSGSEDFNEIDETRDPAFDLSDVSRISEELNTKHKKIEEQEKRKQKSLLDAELKRIQEDKKELEELRKKNSSPLTATEGS